MPVHEEDDENIEPADDAPVGTNLHGKVLNVLTALPFSLNGCHVNMRFFLPILQPIVPTERQKYEHIVHPRPRMTPSWDYPHELAVN